MTDSKYDFYDDYSELRAEEAFDFFGPPPIEVQALPDLSTIYFSWKPLTESQLKKTENVIERMTKDSINLNSIKLPIIDVQTVEKKAEKYRYSKHYNLPKLFRGLLNDLNRQHFINWVSLTVPLLPLYPRCLFVRQHLHSVKAHIRGYLYQRNRFRRYENYYGTLPRIEPAKNTTVERRLHRRNSDVSSRNYSLLGLPHNLFLFQSPMEDERLSLEREIYLNNIYPSYEMRHSTSHQRPIDSSTPNRLNGMLRQSISENEQPIQSLCCGLNLPRKTILPYHRVEAFNYKSYLIHGPEYNDWIDLWGDIRYSFIYSHIPHTLMMIISIISFCFPLTTVALAMYVKARNNWKERFTVSSQTNPVTSEEAENIYEKNRSKSITQMNYSVAIVTISIIVNFCLIITFLISLQFMDDDDLQKNIINKLFSIFQE